MTTDRLQADPARTLELLWKRVRERGDMPGFSKAIRSIVAAMHGEADREFNMTNTVLSDPVLTQKVLRLANSPMYAVFGQGINTVSKAVIVLGTEAIGHVALGLKLVDTLVHAKPDTEHAREEMGKAVLAGQIARQFAASVGSRDAEEAVVSSMLHGLGRMMASFYLPEYWNQLLPSATDDGAEDATILQVFGMSLAELGRHVAQHWGLPRTLVSGLREIKPRQVDEPLDHEEWLATVATLAYRSAQVVWDDQEKVGSLTDLVSGYAAMLGMESAELLSAIESGRAAVEENPPFQTDQSNETATKSAAPLPKPRDPRAAAQILARGVADLRDVSGSLNTTQLMTMGLEAIHQGLGLHKSIVFLRNPEKQQYRARIYFGNGVQEVLPSLVVGDAYQPDVFHASVATGKMVFVESAQEPLFLSRLPRWWRDAFPMVRSFIVLPLMLGRNSIGFIYGDWGPIQSAPALLGTELTPLNELLALLMTSIEQRRRA